MRRVHGSVATRASVASTAPVATFVISTPHQASGRVPGVGPQCDAARTAMRRNGAQPGWRSPAADAVRGGTHRRTSPVPSGTAPGSGANGTPQIAHGRSAAGGASRPSSRAALCTISRPTHSGGRPYAPASSSLVHGRPSSSP
jgi:hypothetical protein